MRAGDHPAEVHEGFALSWNVGWALTKLERHADSIAHFERSVELEPDNPSANWALGVALLELAEFERAEKVLAESIQQKSSHLNRMSLALLYLKLDRLDDAERVHLDGLAERRTKERLLNYAAFLGDVGRAEEEASVEAEAITAKSERKRPATQ
ncbi:MAG: CDC27 family protein [Deltaproteobacteria bacterium]